MAASKLDAVHGLLASVNDAIPNKVEAIHKQRKNVSLPIISVWPLAPWNKPASIHSRIVLFPSR
jgi:hypothetical protein